ncbi:MAG: hypothetical protein ACOYY3_11005 [Chloroflexota bacterium]
METLFQIQKVQWAAWEEEEAKRPQEDRSPAILTKTVISRWRWSEINDTKLSSILMEEQPIRFSDERLILFLPPFPNDEREFVPVISLEYNPAQECLRLRVGMYRLDSSGKPCGLGFRLESPASHCTGNRNESVHDFYHVQLITKIEENSPPLGLPDWLPCRQPAICIRANNPVDAVLNLILSLYGLNFYKYFLKSIKGQLNIELMPFPK